MAVSLYQGKDPDTLNNIEIGQLTVEHLSKAQRATPSFCNLPST
ncbi:MAG: hypothetical protein P9D89_01905 [Candidatus Contendobacter sp.]|nr:hypothetical protein [Candidatus Contendobacter sp.]